MGKFVRCEEEKEESVRANKRRQDDVEEERERVGSLFFVSQEFVVFQEYLLRNLTLQA